MSSTLAAVLTVVLTLNSVTKDGSRVHAVSADAFRVSALVGGDAELPCDTRPTDYKDTLLLVVWYREDVPIYSFDSRVSGSAAHWAEDALEGRARWLVPPSSALHVARVNASDEAEYRCRVDFLVSPTRNYRIALQVVDPAAKPAIFDEYGKELSGVAGPYSEGDNFQLTCLSRGGNPTPTLRWWRDEAVLAQTEGPYDGTEARSLQLRVRNVTRSLLRAVYTCSADNTPLAPPQRTDVEIQLYLRPLTVELPPREHPLSAGREALITCRTAGARPPALLSWWLDGNQLTTVDKQQTSSDGNETVSVLRWTPELEHDGRALACRVEHRTLDSKRMEASLTLNVQFVPIVRLQLGSKLNPNDIEEGDDVYFECTVQANPHEYKVTWEHNGYVVAHNESAGVLVSPRALVLQKVTRRQAGRYQCSAYNVEGDGKSPFVNLQIMYAPVCRTRDVVVVGVALQETARVLCEVDSHPPPTTFEWTLNNSAGVFAVDAARYTVDKSTRSSTLTYAPAADADYGTLTCRGSNNAGQQRLPCRYTLRPAARPDPLADCRAANHTDTSLQVRCEPGYDGGMKPTYVAEAWAGGILVSNASSSAPLWLLRDLGPSRSLRLLLYAANARGRSEPFPMRVKTLPAPVPPYTEAQGGGRWEVSWAVGGAAGAAVTLLLVTCSALLLVRLKRHRARDYEVSSSAAHKAAPPSTRASLLPADDKNPDVVPLDRGGSGAKSPPQPPPYAAAVNSPAPAAPPPSLSAHSLHRHTPLPPQPEQSNAELGWRTAGDGSSEWLGGARIVPPVQAPAQTAAPVAAMCRARREIVTTRTPLLAAAHQESCV